MHDNQADIVFVTPSYKPLLSQESIGTLILAKKVKLANYSVRIIRFWEANMDDYDGFRNSLSSLILQYNPKIVSFYCRGSEYHIIIDVASLIKDVSSNIKIVFGGPQAELTAEETLNGFKCVDYICCGEGETTIVPLVDMIVKYDASSQFASTIPGLVYRDGEGNVHKNPNPQFLPDNYEHDYNYYELIPPQVLSKSRTISIDVGRGCPYSCTFCSTKTFWKRNFRLRSIGDTVLEMRYIKTMFGDKVYSFTHDLFTANKSRVLVFCKLIHESELKINWSCSSRIDCIDEYCIDQMVSSGLVAIYFGIETGSARMQKLISKKLDIKQCKEVVGYSIKKGVAVTASFIYGFPEESYDDLEETLSVIHELLTMGADVQLHCLDFERGSVLYERYRDSLVFDRDKFSAVFGSGSLSNLVESHSEIFSNYFDYPTELRKQMKYLDIIHAIGKEYPSTYLAVLGILRNKGHCYVDIYMLVLNMVSNSLERVDKSKAQVSKSIAYFLVLKIVSKITDDTFVNKYSLSSSEIEKIKNSIKAQDIV